jgi:hypothetical protein
MPSCFQKQFISATERAKRLGEEVEEQWKELLMSSLRMWTPDIYSTEAGALPSAVNGSVACRPPTRPLQGWLFQRPRPERHLHVPVPALSMTRPRSLRGYLLTNSFVTHVTTTQSKRDTYDQ